MLFKLGKKIWILVLLIVFVVFANGTWSVYQKSSFASENRELAQKELEELKVREIALREELVRLETKRGLEEEVRQKFDVGLEGEKMIVLVDAPEKKKLIEPREYTLWEKVVRMLGFK